MRYAQCDNVAFLHNLLCALKANEGKSEAGL